MKSKLILAFLFICGVSCGNSSNRVERKYAMGAYGDDYIVSGMHYVFYSQYNGGAFAVNVTKDSLEAEYYKQQLNKK